MPCPDEAVGIEIRLADGRRDIFISQNVEARSASSPTLPTVRHLVEKESGARFEGDLCLIRFDAAKQPQRILFCQGKSLRVGNLVVHAKSDDASFEIDLRNKNAPVVAGSADAVELIEIAGVKVWPK